MNKYIFAVVFCLLTSFCNNCFPQVNVEWFSTYDGGYSPRLTNDMAIDSEGSVYLVGDISQNPVESQSAFGTVKYNSNGEMQWADLYQGSLNRLNRAEAVAVDKNNNVYVTGTCGDLDSAENFCTIKYNSDGKRLWIKKYQQASGYRDRGKDISLDSDGNVYVTGQSSLNFNPTYINTIKYDSSGNLVWVSQFTEKVNYNKGPVSLTVDNNTNVYVTGYIDSDSNSYDFCTVKYDQHGEQQWVSYFNYANLRDVPCDIKLDKNQNICILGRSLLNVYDEFYTTVIKYDKNGFLLWSYETDSIGLGGSSYYSNKMSFEIDSAGNSYIGTSYKNNCSLIKLDSNGNQLWNSKFNDQPPYPAIGRAVCIDNKGFIYVNGSATKFGVRDFCTLKYNSEGILIWSRIFQSSEYTDYESSFIKVHNSGDTYIAGICYNGGTGGTRFCTIKYSQSVGISSISAEIPGSYNLFQNYPNPFNPKTIIQYELPVSNLVSLKVYDILGNEILTIVNEKQTAGKYEAEFEGEDLASGVYFYKLSAGEFTQTKRMVLLK